MTPRHALGGRRSRWPRPGLRSALLLGLVLCGCAASGPPLDLDSRLEAPPGGPLYVSPDSYDFSRNPELLQRITDSPYGYFRFINIPFAREVCRRFSDEIEELPLVNLHGDAHLEQYAVTDEGYGLTDFDDACSGPAVLDLVRFSTSILLVSDLRGWGDQSHRLLRAFFEGYESALRDPDRRLPVPGYVQQTLAAFPRERESFLQWVDSILGPIEEEEWTELAASFREYARRMYERNPRMRRGYFDLQRAGRIGLGVGSALDRKYLFRVEGPTEAKADDVVLEVKEVRDLSAIPCVKGGEGRGAFRILLGYSRIGRVPFDLIAPLPRSEEESADDASFWVHAWQAHYEEVSVDDPTLELEDCEELARAAGLQLGLGHVRDIGDPHVGQLRAMQLSLVEGLRTRIVEVAIEMTRHTERAWERFRDQALATGLQ